MSNNLILFRKRFNITQGQIAEVIGKARNTVSMKELGKVPFTQEEIEKITKLIKEKNPNITVEDIFFKDLIGEMPMDSLESEENK